MWKMRNIKKQIGIYILVFLLGLSPVLLVSMDNDEKSFEISKNLDIFYTLYRELDIFYVDETDPGDLIKTAIDKMLKSLDPYTNFIPEADIEDYKFMTTGQYGGIGALIRNSDNHVVISEPYEGYPAEKAGFKAGDEIIKIDDKSIKGKKVQDISQFLKGQPGTELTITVKRPGVEEPIEKTLTREKVEIRSVPYYGMVDDKTAYIRLTKFTRNCSDDVKDAFIELKEKHGAESVILDLRNNPGGFLIEAVNICNIFMPKGQKVVSTKGKISQWDKTYKTMFQPIDTLIPVVVLVNRSSASASEIVSGAFQDIERGVVIGRRTFGKGLVQTTRDLSYNAKLKVTTAKYYIPSGRCIQALDYSHRNEDGSVGKVPDSLITEYETQNGRKVLDGGGIMPDILIEPKEYSNITYALIRKHLIFDYATNYCMDLDTIDPPTKFVFTDDDYHNFKEFIKDKEFSYKTTSENKLESLIKISKKEKYYKIAKKEFAELEKKLAHDQAKDLEVFKDEIKDLISNEIIGRFYHKKGRLKAMIDKDVAVDSAMVVLKNTEKYNNILDASYEIPIQEKIAD